MRATACSRASSVASLQYSSCHRDGGWAVERERWSATTFMRNARVNWSGLAGDTRTEASSCFSLGSSRRLRARKRRRRWSAIATRSRAQARARGEIQRQGSLDGLVRYYPSGSERAISHSMTREGVETGEEPIAAKPPKALSDRFRDRATWVSGRAKGAHLGAGAAVHRLLEAQHKVGKLLLPFLRLGRLPLLKQAQTAGRTRSFEVEMSARASRKPDAVHARDLQKTNRGGGREKRVPSRPSALRVDGGCRRGGSYMCCMRIFRLGMSASDCQVFQELFPPPLAPAMPTPLGAPAPFPCISAAASFRYFTDSFRKRGEIQALIDSARSLLATRKSPLFAVRRVRCALGLLNRQVRVGAATFCARAGVAGACS